MIRIVIGTLLAVWAIYVAANNSDFWDGFVFPWATGSLAIYLVLTGRSALAAINRQRPHSGSSAASAHPISSSDSGSSASRGLAAKIFEAAAISVVGDVILKIISALAIG